jgi:hypothetical protein
MTTTTATEIANSVRRAELGLAARVGAAATIAAVEDGSIAAMNRLSH